MFLMPFSHWMLKCLPLTMSKVLSPLLLSVRSVRYLEEVQQPPYPERSSMILATFLTMLTYQNFARMETGSV